MGGTGGFNFLVEFFPIEGAVDETSSAPIFNSAEIVRFTELAAVAAGLFCYILARYGVRGTLDLTRTWRFCILLLAVGASL